MTIDDRVPDHAELRRIAAARVRRGRIIGFGLALAAFVLPTVVLLVTDRTSTNPAVLFVPALIGIVVLVVTFAVVGRLDGAPLLVAGADRQTRRAVQQALRTGAPADARIDALTRDTAARTARRGWLVWLFVPFVLLQVVVLVSRVMDGDGAGRLALSVGTTTVFIALLVSQVVTWHRCRRYLARPSWPGDAVEGRAS